MGSYWKVAFGFLLAVCVGISVPASAQQPKPKAYVITGWNASASNKKAHDAIADQAQKNLEAAGYAVTRITQGTADQIKAAMKDPDGQAMVFIDHGGVGAERIVGRKADGSKDRVYGSDFTTGPYNNYKVMTIHACDQSQQSWKDKFPKADFFSWKGCIYASDELAWEKNKKYSPATNPPSPSESDIEEHHLLIDGQFDMTDGDAVPIDPEFNRNFLMEPGLAASFGNLSYNFLVRNQYTGIDEVIYGAQIAGGQKVVRVFDELIPGANFNFIMTYDEYVHAIQNPYLLMSPGVLGSSVFITDITGTTASPETLFAGVRRNEFFVPEPSAAAGLVMGLFGFLGFFRRAPRN